MTDIKIFAQMVTFQRLRKIKVNVILHTDALRSQKGIKKNHQKN